MRKFLIAVVVLVGVAALIAGYLLYTTPSRSAGVKFPLSDAQRALLAQVPASAEELALIPTAAAVEAKLRANPITSDLLDRLAKRQPLPRPWMLGNTDVVMWTSGKRTIYLVHLDPLRATVARAYLMLIGDDTGSFVINAPSEAPIDRAELDRILALTNGMEPADAIAIQRSSGRGAFPPIGRPAVSAVSVTPDEILITSRAAAEGNEVVQPLHVRFPRTALLTASFSKQPRALDLGRLMAKEVTTLLADGGTLAIYDIDTGTLLPKPREVIALPATPERRVALAALGDAIGKTGREMTGLQTSEMDGELVVSFDRKSESHYLKDGFDAPRWPANVWSARIDPARMIPLLNEMDGNAALRIVAPRLHRSIRDLRHWIGALEKAKSIEAADSVSGGIEELRVRVAVASPRA
jgi:hypothetical protein